MFARARDSAVFTPPWGGPVLAVWPCPGRVSLGNGLPPVARQAGDDRRGNRGRRGRGLAWLEPARAALMGAEVPLAHPAGAGADPAAGGLLDHRFDARGLPLLRVVVLARAVEAGMPEDRAEDVMLAVHELAANVVRHGAGTGRLQMMAGDEMLRVQVHDAGPASQTGQAGTTNVDGHDVPDGGDGGWPRRPGHGLWLVRRLADQMSVWRGPGGTVVTAVFALPAAQASPAPAEGADC